MALGALQVLEVNGRNVPQDISLTGFDNTEDSRCVIPPLTTAQQLVYEMGWSAGKLMLSNFLGEETDNTVVVPPTMIIRESCGCSNQSVEKAAVAYRPMKTGNPDL